jgi:hypothetical protein
MPATATLPAAPKTGLARLLSWYGAGRGAWGMLRLTTQGVAKLYWLTCVREGEYELATDDFDVRTVWVSGGAATCDCRGYRSVARCGRKCKHARAVASLLSAGKI